MNLTLVVLNILSNWYIFLNLSCLLFHGGALQRLKKAPDSPQLLPALNRFDELKKVIYFDANYAHIEYSRFDLCNLGDL